MADSVMDGKNRGGGGSERSSKKVIGGSRVFDMKSTHSWKCSFMVSGKSESGSRLLLGESKQSPNRTFLMVSIICGG